MPEMSTTEVETESIPYGEERTSQNAFEQFLVWFVRFAAAGYLTVIVYGIWLDPEIRLYTLHSITRVLHNIARLIGSIAIASEKAYYSTAGEFQ